MGRGVAESVAGTQRGFLPESFSLSCYTGGRSLPGNGGVVVSLSEG